VSVSVAFVVYDGVDVRDLAAPYGLLAASNDAQAAGGPPFTLFTVGRTKELVTLHGGLKLLPDHIYPDAHIYDAVVVPGGPGYQEALALLRLMGWLARAARQARLVAGVGTGIFLLGAAGLLAGQSVAAVPGVQERFPAAIAVAGEAVVCSGKVVTVAGHQDGESLGRLIASHFYPP
jgi:transcriptional regulator GlxA family with amidase domain